MPVLRLRLALALVSAATIALELALMRALSLRFWSHFAYMVISVALLGFGASGTALTLLRRRVLARPMTWLCALALLLPLAILAVPRAADMVPLNVQFLAWSPAQLGNVLGLELLMAVPFLIAGGIVGIALMDRPERIGGHYAANLVGSGLGAVLVVLAMEVLDTSELFTALAAAAFVAAALIVPWRRARAATASGAVAVVLVLLAVLAPWEPAVSEYKMLPQAMDMPDTREIYRTEGPLGRIDVVEGPAVRYAPGLSLQYVEPLPPHALLITDGDQVSSVYDCAGLEDWAFMDQTTGAAAYHVCGGPRVLVVGAGGGSGIGLALYHGRPEVVALEMNRDVIATMTGPLRGRGGDVYRADAVTVVNREARGYLAGTGRRFDIIDVPAIDAFGASGAGLYATQESYLYTVESFGSMLDHLSDGGVLGITRWARTPPRDELRAFDMAAAALRGRGLDPASHLAMIRNWATVTVLTFKEPLTAGQAAKLRAFCEARGFDLCALPGLDASETNEFHVLARPYYFGAARALLGSGRDAYINDYVFDIRPVTDDRPYFFHTFRWRSMPVLMRRLGGMSPAFLELGYIMSVAALVQGLAAAAVFILLPLLGRAGELRAERRRTAVFGYFLLLGVGFMLLEIGFMQKLILYLAHPIYSAAAVITSFLVFSGLGSRFSSRWSARPKRIIGGAAVAVVLIAAAYSFVLDGWLGLTQAGSMPLRFLVACATIAPLAFAMGHMFPCGLRQVAGSGPALVPWAWAVNGFASVAATVGTPLLAAEVGFARVILAAVLCYALAGLVSRRLPG